MIIRQMFSHDINSVADIHQTSFSGDLLTKLGRNSLLAQYQWFIRQYPSLCIVCEINRGVAAFVVGATPSYRQTLLRQIAPVLFRDLLLHPKVAVRYGKHLFRAGLPYLRSKSKHVALPVTSTEYEDTLTPREYRLAVVAVSPLYRRQGIATHLLLAFEERVKSMGAGCISLSVRTDNASARAAYQKTGWYLSALSDTAAIYKKDI